MDTPIVDFVKNYAESKKIRLHMPGHKGLVTTGAEDLDITEIDGADVLYGGCGDGIITKSQNNASHLFGSAKTLYSAGGSSLSVRAMLYLITLYAIHSGKKPSIAAFRNAHKTFVTAAALLDFETTWLYPQDSNGIISCNITPNQLEEELCKMAEKPTAVYVTCPDYLGNMADIKGISAVCKKHGVLLAVDNAHGAYLKFLPQDMHPITLGADICCDSAHKTLPVLTGGGYLHISKNAPQLLCENAENAMMLFASTSPSYLILQSLDSANKYIAKDYTRELSDFCEKLCALKSRLCNAGYELCGAEPLKISVKAKPYGYSGYEFAKMLEHCGIVCEFCDPDYTVLMLTPQNKKELTTVEKALLSIPKKAALTSAAPPLAKPKTALTPRQAMFCAGKQIPVRKSCGKTLCAVTVSCPPAIPIAVCGEVIDEAAIKLFEYYGIETVYVTE